MQTMQRHVPLTLVALETPDPSLKKRPRDITQQEDANYLLDVAKHFFDQGKRKTNNMELAFDEGDHKEVAVEFHVLGKNVGVREFEKTFRWCCENGYLGIAQWMMRFGIKISEVSIEYGIRWSCYNGHIAMAKWLRTLNVGGNEAWEDGFMWACIGGDIQMAKWIQSFSGVDVYLRNSGGFRMAALNGHCDIVVWLYPFMQDDIKEWIRDSLKYKQFDYPNVIECLEVLIS